MKISNLLGLALASTVLGACGGGNENVPNSSSSTNTVSSISIASSSSVVSVESSSSVLISSSEADSVSSASLSSSSIVESSSAVVTSSSEAESVSSSSQSSISVVSSSSSPQSNIDGGVSKFTDLPKEMYLTDDGERLVRGGKKVKKFYNPLKIETIYIDFDEADYKSRLDQNYDSKTLLEATITYKEKKKAQAGVRYRGNTSYYSSSGKKSFAIDLEWKVPGQDINGYNKLKLNNAFEDASNMREVLYSNLSREHIASVRANFMNVVVNGENWGVYANVQKLNKDHAREWFLSEDATRWRAEVPDDLNAFGGGVFGTGVSTLNDLGASGSDYEPYYTLKGSSVMMPWQDLANAAHTLGQTPKDQIIEKLSPYLDIDSALWFLATENIFADDDSYIYKGGMDYYLYFDVATNRIVPIEYDGNSVLQDGHLSWTPFHFGNNFGEDAKKEDFPLINILLDIPELRQRYLAHYRVILEDILNPESSNEVIDQYAALIDSHVEAPAVVGHYTVDEYQRGKSELKEAIKQRYDFLKEHNEVKASGITIINVEDSVGGKTSVRPTESQEVDVVATVNTQQAVFGLNLYYGKGLMGTFSKVAMSNEGSGRYSAKIPAQEKGEYVRYYVEAVADNEAKTASYNPKGAEHDVYIYQVLAANQVVGGPVVINEIMPSNDTTVMDEEGDFGDWIELYNNSDVAVDLSGYTLSDEDVNLQRWALPAGTSIAAKSTLIIWADKKDKDLHANFKLSSSGENVYLVTPAGEIADQVQFEESTEDQSYARMPNGTGAFSWTSESTHNASN